MTTQSIEADGQTSLAPTHQDEVKTGLEFVASTLEAGVLLLPEDRLLMPIGRLLVLIPDEDVNETGLAHFIWSLASARGWEVVLVGAVWQGDEAYTRRRLITLANQIRDGRIRVKTSVRPHKSWLQAVAELWRPGDLIVCHAQQKVSTNGLKRQPLSQILLTTHHAPVYVLRGFYSRLPLEISTRWGKWLSLAIPVLIIVGFFLFQSWMTQWRTSWFYFPALILSVLIEAGLIAVWEGVFDLI